tara:strand:+ start:99 stop:632 length:534 start_codon:yes stop_codon:yes gene_type:complete
MAETFQPINEGEKRVFFVLLISLLTIISPFLLGFSFGTVDPGWMALDWNQNTNDIGNDKLFTQGRYFIGLGHQFIKFPRYVKQYISPADEYVSTRTMDGLGVDMKIAYTSQLSPDLDDVVSLYRRYGEKYDDLVQKISLSSIRDVVANYKGFELVSKREELARELGSHVSREPGNLH